MTEEITDTCGKRRHHRHDPAWIGPIWFIGWLFTIGYLHLPFFWKGVLALIVWPYYLGIKLAPTIPPQPF